ncbi:hypothetical protein K438DRAFT_1955238 [Mycena galopus ATCC 62051]|nr:hypothetical protein K438DRAFT_1955238 [Mycena galopus ATCC 62051]
MHSFSLEEITGRAHPDAPITTFVDRVSLDQRRHYREEVAVAPPSPVKRACIEAQAEAHEAATMAPPAGAVPDFEQPDRYEMGLEEEEGHDNEDVSRPSTPVLVKTVKPSDPALHRFRARRNEYLRALHYRQGRMKAELAKCGDCGEATPTIHCKDCYGDEMLCRPCCVARHSQNPLHRVERWNGEFFLTSSLKSLGLRVQLSHPPLERCAEPLEAHCSFVVLHTNGIHEVAVDTCDCEHRATAGPPEIQMLRAGWFPATDDRPRTCAMLACLDLFMLTTLQAKTTAYNFYKVLERITDHTGEKLPNRYHPFLRMSREYRHLQMLKHGERGYDKDGVEGTKPGELAVRCPCCPQPGINLDDGWEKASPQDRFLYILFLALDACFRLKWRMVSSKLKDPSLGPGMAYMVETQPYRAFLRTKTDQKEMSTCSGLAALDHANTKFTRGYSATGVGMGVCARHEFIQPNGVGDLQKGERYVNIDYIFASILRHWHSRLRKIVSYDIVCQWFKNLEERLLLLPPLVRLQACMAIMRFVIPKLHIKGHLGDCQIEFSLNYVPGSAQTDGEGIERPWANIGGVASSTREMGPGSREDTLNCHWGYWNWEKILGLAERLRTRTDKAQLEYASQMEAFTVFSVQQSNRIPGWRAMVEKFKKDPTAKNPYQRTEKCENRVLARMTEAEVLLKLENEEAERVAAGDEQRRVRVQVQLKKAQTTAQQIDIVTLRRDLSRKIRRLRLLQVTYMPGAIVALEEYEAPVDETPENSPLFLPSALPASVRAQDPLHALSIIENSLRDAQLCTSLSALRSQLHVKDQLFTYKRLQAQNQGANTRARGIVNQNEMNIRLHSEKYQMAWEAKRLLEGGDADMVEDVEKRKKRAERLARREDDLQRAGELPPLTSEERERQRRAMGESTREISWIWTGAGEVGTDSELEEALRIEWVKSYARTRRWEEETRLLAEEEERARKLDLEAMTVEEGEGAMAYAMKQAAMYHRIGTCVAVTMTEVRLGKGRKRRPQVDDDEEMPDVRDAWDEEDEVGADEDEAELRDLRRDVADKEHVLDGGDDEAALEPCLAHSGSLMARNQRETEEKETRGWVTSSRRYSTNDAPPRLDRPETHARRETHSTHPARPGPSARNTRRTRCTRRRASRSSARRTRATRRPRVLRTPQPTPPTPRFPGPAPDAADASDAPDAPDTTRPGPSAKRTKAQEE